MWTSIEDGAMLRQTWRMLLCCAESHWEHGKKKKNFHLKKLKLRLHSAFNDFCNGVLFMNNTEMAYCRRLCWLFDLQCAVRSCLRCLRGRQESEEVNVVDFDRWLAVFCHVPSDVVLNLDTITTKACLCFWDVKVSPEVDSKTTLPCIFPLNINYLCVKV